jgi:hypothetical protein
VSHRWTAADLDQLAKRSSHAKAGRDAVNELLISKYSRAKRTSSSTQRARPMNKLEAAFAQRIELERLAGLWQWWAFEAITLRLAHDTRYTPDFAALDPGGHLVLHETKGFWRDDAKVKIKVAAELYPFFRFIAWTRQRKKDGGGWIETQY